MNGEDGFSIVVAYIKVLNKNPEEEPAPPSPAAGSVSGASLLSGPERGSDICSFG